MQSMGVDPNATRLSSGQHSELMDFLQLQREQIRERIQKYVSIELNSSSTDDFCFVHMLIESRPQSSKVSGDIILYHVFTSNAEQ